jgi:hypothetical protein
VCRDAIFFGINVYFLLDEHVLALETGYSAVDVLGDLANGNETHPSRRSTFLRGLPILRLAEAA